MGNKITEKEIIIDETFFRHCILDLRNNPERLKKTGKLDYHFNISFAEFYVLSVIGAFRKFIESSGGWVIRGKDDGVSDDGYVLDLQYEHQTDKFINSLEKIETTYLCEFSKGSNYFEKRDYTVNNKINHKQGVGYRYDKSLVIINDMDSERFDSHEFLKGIFPENRVNFSHFYFILFDGKTDDSFYLRLMSYTDRPYRKFLNGMFRLEIFTDGKYKFKKIQDIDLSIPIFE
ncbi:MAG: hypothetical protein PHC89_00870 [Candidatus Pacebacteria bacterium]|nr:hypothetical protein [Candidatus Paceibacterota bacterium]